MNPILGLVLALTLGAGLGLGSARLAVERGAAPGAARAGPWRATPAAGTPDADPYLRAHLARGGEAPLAPAEGLELRAEADDAGRALDSGCDYRVRGPGPAARAWTLSPYRPDGAPIDHPLGRRGLTSAEPTRLGGEPFDVTLSEEARPGAWLPVAGGRFVLLLRLLDAPLGTAAALDAGALPRIERGACR